MTTQFSLAEIASWCGGTVVGDSRAVVSSAAVDSRECCPGSLFIAVSGTRVNGAAFAADAQRRGATAILHEGTVLTDLPTILVPSARRAESAIAHRLSGRPSDKLVTLGVTGTNGKTTVHWLLGQLLDRVGWRSLRIGTLGVFLPDGSQEETNLTTPGALRLHGALRKGLDSGARAAVMEASSHALALHRLDDVAFDGAIFTNLTRDHLDFHGTMEEYFKAKERLFSLLAASSKPRRLAVIFADDEYGARLAATLRGTSVTTLTVGYATGRDLQIKHYQGSAAGSEFSVLFGGERHTVSTSLIGAHNAENLSVVIAMMVGLGFDLGEVVAMVPALTAAPGRLERVTAPRGPTVLVDYAHTPDALERALSALRPLTTGRLVALFGCGGDRDRGKRPIMGEIADRLADRVVLTSDNPRTERPASIIAEVRGGCRRPPWIEAVDRREAIGRAIAGSSANDVVLIAGKGHEDYQIIGTEKHPFSDQREAARVLASWRETSS